MSWRRGPPVDRRRWAKVRRAVLDKARWRCRKCGNYANEVDHIQPLHQGGAVYDLANLQALCRFPCHALKTRRENSHPIGPERLAWRAKLREIRI